MLQHRLARGCALFLPFLIAACGSHAPRDGRGPIEVSSVAPYISEQAVSKPVRQNCQLETQLPAYLADQSEQVRLVQGEPQGRRVLRLRITQAEGVPGGIWSGSKSVTVEGELVEDGRIVGSFRARDKAGQFGNGWSSTCSLLAGNAKNDAKSIAKWLLHPTMNARLGDTE